MERDLEDGAAGVDSMTQSGNGLFASSRSLVTVSQPQSAAAESVRILRTHLMAQHFQEGRRGLTVCAPSSGTGCTFIATNLAVALSQIGVKTLLIDGNLRNPGVQDLIQPRQSPRGLQDYLSSQDLNIGDCLVDEILPNLAVMYAGGGGSASPELLGGARFEMLVSYCLREFGATIIDTPAANSCSDARRIGSVVGYSILVAQKDRTRVENLKTLIGELKGDGVRIVGTVLNEF